MASNVDTSEELSKLKLSNPVDDINYFDLKLNYVKKTQMYVKFAKVMIIAQGAYSRERVKAFETIKNEFKYASCIISDKTYQDEFTTICKPEKTEEFYVCLKNAAKKALEEGNNLLVIDSTMSNIYQNRYYVALAHKMQYVLLILPPIVMKSKIFWPEGSLADSFRTEASTVIQPVNMFQHLFCAWFLHDIDSYELRHLATLYVQDCMQEIPEFTRVMSKNCPKQDSNGENLSPIDSIRLYYSLVDKRQDIAYCAVKVFGDSMISMNEYFKNKSVVDAYGKTISLNIVGFIISKHMIAARVKLTEKQKPLWDMVDELPSEALALERLNLLCPSKLLEESKQNLPDVDVQLICSKSRQTLEKVHEKIWEPLEIISPFFKGRACHIVLGKAIDAPSYNVDYDVQFALRREKKFFQDKVDLPIDDLGNCIVKRIGQYWFIYMKEKYRVDAFFASCVKPYAYDDAIA